MCGFFGVIDFKDKLTSDDKADVKKGIESTRYRGPDDQKILSDDNYCFGFNRLSIIDLNAENQPYHTNDKSIIMMCNGEIYNFQELKKTLITKGYKFKTKTDVEVILHGYIEWGDTFWNKLNGIFSIALFDRRKKKFFLIRDHMGVKPLHYFIKGTKIYFGSDYNSFLTIHDHSHSFNRSALLSYLSFRNVIGKQTFYKGIFDILPGTEIIYDGKHIKETQYWDIPTDTQPDKGIDFFTNQLDELINKSVKRQMVSDVPLGAFISGGLDSSILLSFIKKYKPDLKTYITGFEDHGYNEFKYADIVANHLNLNNPEKLIIKPTEYIDSLEKTIKFKGEPISVPHENAFLKMSNFMKKDISVVMSGEGADELFAGYGRIFRSPHDYYMSKKPILGKLINYSNHNHFSNPMDHFLLRYSWFTNYEKKQLLKKDFINNTYDEYSLKYIESLFSKVSHLSYFDGIYYLLGKLHLTNLLNRLDRMTMASSVEARVPFLDIDIVEFASKLPSKYKLRWKNKISEFVSKFYNSEKISEKLDIPKYILKRVASPKLPNSIIHRKKMGFPVPLNNWASKKLGEYAYDILTSTKSKSKEYFDISIVEKFIKKNNYDAKEDLDGKKIWMLVNIELWLQKQNF